MNPDGTITPFPDSMVTGSTPKIGDVWTYRSRATFVPPGDMNGDELEAEARAQIIAEAARALPEELATIELLSVRRTPTGRWSAMVKRTRVALELPEEPSDPIDRMYAEAFADPQEEQDAREDARMAALGVEAHQQAVMKLRSLTLTHEQASLTRVALNVLLGTEGILTTEHARNVVAELENRVNQIVMETR